MTIRALALPLAFLWLALPAQAEHLPFKYLSTLKARWSEADIVCTATVSGVEPTGDLPIIEGTKVREYVISANVDRVFKSNWAEQRIAFRSYGLYSPEGIVQYVGPPLAEFQPSSRYLFFLRNGAPPEVVTPVFETAILLAPRGTTTRYLGFIPYGTSVDNSALAAELIAAIYAQPPQRRNSEEYFGHIGELLGGVAAAQIFETIYQDRDPALREVAAKMASEWSNHDPIVDEHASKVLLAVAADSSAPEFSRADATLYLSEMHVQEARPYAEQIVVEGRDATTREFGLRALVRVGTKASEPALMHALTDSVLANKFLATLALQEIECGTSLDEDMFRRDSERTIVAWESYSTHPLTKPPCMPFKK
jgi:hypothetical protein